MVYGSTDSCVYGSADTCVYGFMVLRAHGFVDSWVHGFVDSHPHGFVDSQTHGLIRCSNITHWNCCSTRDMTSDSSSLITPSPCFESEVRILYQLAHALHGENIANAILHSVQLSFSIPSAGILAGLHIYNYARLLPCSAVVPFRPLQRHSSSAAPIRPLLCYSSSARCTCSANARDFNCSLKQPLRHCRPPHHQLVVKGNAKLQCVLKTLSPSPPILSAPTIGLCAN